MCHCCSFHLVDFCDGFFGHFNNLRPELLVLCLQLFDLLKLLVFFLDDLVQHTHLLKTLLEPLHCLLLFSLNFFILLHAHRQFVHKVGHLGLTLSKLRLKFLFLFAHLENDFDKFGLFLVLTLLNFCLGWCFLVVEHAPDWHLVLRRPVDSWFESRWTIRLVFVHVVHYKALVEKLLSLIRDWSQCFIFIWLVVWTLFAWKLDWSEMERPRFQIVSKRPHDPFLDVALVLILIMAATTTENVVVLKFWLLNAWLWEAEHQLFHGTFLDSLWALGRRVFALRRALVVAELRVLLGAARNHFGELRFLRHLKCRAVKPTWHPKLLQRESSLVLEAEDCLKSAFELRVRAIIHHKDKQALQNLPDELEPAVFTCDSLLQLAWSIAVATRKMLWVEHLHDVCLLIKSNDIQSLLHALADSRCHVFELCQVVLNKALTTWRALRSFRSWMGEWLFGKGRRARGRFAWTWRGRHLGSN